MGDYKYAWIGVPPPSCSGCIQQTDSPNGDAGIDAAVNTLAHELAEACTDPVGTGWCYDSDHPADCNGGGTVENGDQCAWYFPDTPAGENYNLQVGSLNYLIQANWNLYYGDCLMYY